MARGRAGDLAVELRRAALASRHDVRHDLQPHRIAQRREDAGQCDLGRFGMKGLLHAWARPYSMFVEHRTIYSFSPVISIAGEPTPSIARISSIMPTQIGRAHV